MGDCRRAGSEPTTGQERGVSDAFWAERAVDDAQVAALKAEKLRAEREADLLAKIGPDACSRICCGNRWSTERCNEGECIVLANFY